MDNADLNRLKPITFVQSNYLYCKEAFSSKANCDTWNRTTFYRNKVGQTSHPKQ